MPIVAVDEDGQGQPLASLDEDIDFSFVPQVLVEYCKTFIVTHHKLNGFFSLPNIMWHPETRKFRRWFDAEAAVQKIIVVAWREKGE